MCELDLIFNFETLHACLGEMVVGGVVVETGLEKVVGGVRAGGSVRKRREERGLGGMGGLGMGVGVEGLVGMGRGWR